MYSNEQDEKNIGAGADSGYRNIQFGAHALAADVDRETKAGVDFLEGDTIIEPALTSIWGVSTGEIYFGKHCVESRYHYIQFRYTHNDEDRQYAGYIVRAANSNGWTVTAQITNFKLDGNITMLNFDLELTPGDVVTSEGTVYEKKPVAMNASLVGPGEGQQGFMATAWRSSRPRKATGWADGAVNWEGDLTVVGGSVEKAGNATATILWSLAGADVRI